MSEQKKKALSKDAKTGITIGVIIAVIMGILVGGLVYLTQHQNEAYSKLIIAAMPKTITGVDNGVKIDFYIEYNKDFDEDKDEPIKAYQVYYFDKDGKRVDLALGHYQSATADMQVTMGFLFKAQEKIDSYKNVFRVCIALLIIVILALLIFLWYKSWVRRESAKKRNYINDFADQDKE